MLLTPIRSWRAATLEAWQTGMQFAIPRWDTYIFAESSAHPELVGRRLRDVADERGAHPFDVLLDAALDEPDLSLRVELRPRQRRRRRACTRSSPRAGCTLGLSDAGAHVGQLCDAPQATDYLGNWVRDRSLTSWESAVARLTSRQADIFGLDDRGRLTPGSYADVVVFDPATVGPGPVRRVADFPTGSERLTADAPTGIRHVLVNGTPIRVDGSRTSTLAPVGSPGRPSVADLTADLDAEPLREFGVVLPEVLIEVRDERPVLALLGRLPEPSPLRGRCRRPLSARRRRLSTPGACT